MEQVGRTKTNVHEPYKALVENNGVDKLSRLNNVCISLDEDMLLIEEHQRARWSLRYLERHELRHISLNLGKWLKWSASMKLLQKFDGVKEAAIFNREGDRSLHQFRADQIEVQLLRAEKDNAKRGSRYVAPFIAIKPTRMPFEWKGSLDEWYTCQYPKGYKSRRADAQAERSKVDNRFTGIFGSHGPQPSGPSQRMGTGLVLETTLETTAANRIPLPARFGDSSPCRKATNRKRHREDTDISVNPSRKAAKLSQKTSTLPFIIQPVKNRLGAQELEGRFLNPEIAEVEGKIAHIQSKTAEEAFAKIREAQEWLRSPPPVAGAHEETEDVSEEHFRNLFDLDFEDFVQSSSPDMTDMEELIPDPRDLLATFSSPVKVSPNPMRMYDADLLDENAPPFSDFVDPRAFFNPYDTQATSDDMPRNDLGFRDSGFYDMMNGGSIIETGEGPALLQEEKLSIQLNADADQIIAETSGITLAHDQESSVHLNTDQIIAQTSEDTGPQNDQEELSMSLRSENEEESIAAKAIAVLRSLEHITKTSSITLSDQTKELASEENTASVQTANITVTPLPAPILPTFPGQIIAERRVSHEVQYLVVLSDNTESWVEARSLLKTSPDLVQNWKLRIIEDKSNVIEQPVLENVVEKILSKRKFKGIPHYLVKWEGYELEKDRTWEPCSRLRVDVPGLVEDYEEKLSRKGKGKAKGKK